MADKDKDNKEGRSGGGQGGSKSGEERSGGGRQGGSKEGGKEGKDSIAGGLGTTKHDKDAKNKLNHIADLDRSPWGHLPESKRLEMDAYSRERFMPRYEDLLRQYYRTIAEQGRRKDD